MNITFDEPAAHGKHSPPSGPAYPAGHLQSDKNALPTVFYLHLQSSSSILPGTDMEFAGQSAQSEENISTSQSDNGPNDGTMKDKYRPKIGVSHVIC